MLDENLPTFRLRPSSDSPLSSILYFTQHGSDPSAEYLIRRPDPALPESRNKYALALCDPFNPDVVYGEVMVEPEWTQPTLSAAEIRAQAQSGAGPAPAAAIVPDSFTIQLYNPDQTVAVKMVPGTWNKSDSWEFDLPVQTFRTPTSSQLDREQQNASPAAADLIPRIMFRWKKEGRLSKEMTCYMSGTRLGARKNKEPDITIAMFKAARESVMTIYQPNLRRVELEDRKGLELILLLGSEVIRDLYLSPKVDVFNVQGGGPVLNGNKRKNSRPTGSTTDLAGIGAATMSGAVAAAVPPAAATSTPAVRPPPPTTAAANNAAPGPASRPEIDAETRRLQALVEREERERRKAELAEQKRIQKMIQEEEKERRRREAEIAKETERLRKKYGVEGQELPSDRPPLPPRVPNSTATSAAAAAGGAATSPTLPLYSHPQQGLSPWGSAAPAMPPRPVSAGPYSQPSGVRPQQRQQQQQQQQQQQGPFHSNTLNVVWKGAAGQLQQLQSRVQQQQQQRPGRTREEEERRRRVQKKRSSHW